MFYLSEKPVFFTNIANTYILEKPRLHPIYTCNGLLFQVVLSCLNSCQVKIKTSYFLMPLIKHKYTSSVEKYMLANQKVRGSILCQFLLFCANLHEFLHRNYKVKHKFKTREVHEKCS